MRRCVTFALLGASCLAAGPAWAAPNPAILPCAIALDDCAEGGPRSRDGAIDPGEEITLAMAVENRGSSDATNVRVLVSTTNPAVTLLDDTGDYGTIGAGATKLPSPPIRFTVARDTPCGTAIVFDLTVAYDGGIRRGQCSLAVAGSCFGCGQMLCDPAALTPWSTGPYGTDLYQTADDFTVPTLEGATQFQPLWTGCDSHVFVIRHDIPSNPGFSQYSQQLWSSSVGTLIAASPRNVHYWFVSAQADPTRAAAEVDAMRVRTQAAINALAPPDRSYWGPRFHHVTTGAYGLGNWISDMLAARGVTAFAIDPLQRIRQIGLLYAVGGPGVPQMAFLTHEVRHYNFEKEVERRLAAETFTDVTLWEAATQPFGGGVSVDVDLPDADTMAGFDTMQLDLSFECTDPWDNRSCEWDYLANLSVCDPDDPARCTEFGRWITAYGRGGRWITDATPLLALIREGGRRTFRFGTPYTYISTLKLRLSNRGLGVRPYEARFMWGGGGFDQTYNPNHAAIDVVVPPYARKTELAALISGHGWGVGAANCAEFCNHEHRFSADGGSEYVKSYPEAQTQSGCVDQIEIGTIPNQYGTWHYGRGGWCPGLDVAPWRADMTASLPPGPHSVAYRATYQGTDYVPDVPGGYWGRIDLSSYLVTYIESPEGDCADGLDDDGDGDLDCADQGCATLTACDGFDSDGDGLVNGADCSPLDPGLASAPVAPLLLAVTKRGTDAVVAWPDAALRFGPSTVGDVATGVISELRADRGYARAACLGRDLAGGETADPRAAGASSDGWWYVIRASNACGSAGFDEPGLAAFTGCDP